MSPLGSCEWLLRSGCGISDTHNRGLTVRILGLFGGLGKMSERLVGVFIMLFRIPEMAK